ncbi:hypothetical protein WN944_010808 [Citrus x changshan-huyou]|uniref:Terpene synthase N-terminal domain-containing protein n=1 Tax=Citrus x changshan-huyou TaxID=2935761 RepID=A0AAP0QXL3_9ROSI
MPTTSCVSLRLGPLVSLRTRSWQQGRSLHSNSLSCICQLSSLPKPLVTDFKTSPRQNVLTYEGDRGTKSLEEELQERTRKALRKSSNDPTATMKLIDTIQRLGIGYHFEDEIMERLERFSDGDAAGEENLFENALRFRLLRQNGLPACTDIFKKFINKEGKLKESVSKDTRGMLSLYEASYLATQDEDILFQAMEFTKTELTQSVSLMDSQSSRHVVQALALPRHLRMSRSEAGNYINEYS